MEGVYLPRRFNMWVCLILYGIFFCVCVGVQFDQGGVGDLMDTMKYCDPKKFLLKFYVEKEE